MNRWLVILSVLAAVSVAMPGQPRAAEPTESPEFQQRAEEAFRDAARKVKEALESLLRSVPQYAMPEIQENGDIIIRRIPQEPSDKTVEPDLPDQTRT